MEGDHLTRVVFACPKSKGLLVRVGVSCDVDRLRNGTGVDGGAGTGWNTLRGDMGSADRDSDTGDGVGFLGGEGALRWKCWCQ